MTVSESPPDQIGRAFVPAPRDTVAWVELDGEAVLYDEASGALHLLDKIATLIWSCFDGRATLAEVIHEFEDAFAVRDGTVERDVLALVRDLGSKGLVSGIRPDDEAVRRVVAATGAPQIEEPCQ